jgi:DNA invertase Pin-like site-specific DNA recombinase
LVIELQKTKREMLKSRRQANNTKPKREQPRTYGYVRVSTDKQDFDRQQSEITKKYDCYKIFEDKFTGTTIDRPGLSMLLATAQTGDTIVVHSLDRLGRNWREVMNLLEALENKEIFFKSTKESFNTEGAMGKMMLQMVLLFGQVERDMIAERTREGLAEKKKQGVKLGRFQSLENNLIQDAIKELYDTGKLTNRNLAKRLNVGVATGYKYMNKFENFIANKCSDNDRLPNDVYVKSKKKSPEISSFDYDSDIEPVILNTEAVAEKGGALGDSQSAWGGTRSQNYNQNSHSVWANLLAVYPHVMSEMPVGFINSLAASFPNAFDGMHDNIKQMLILGLMDMDGISSGLYGTSSIVH